jgi:hypothetical protein
MKLSQIASGIFLTSCSLFASKLLWEVAEHKHDHDVTKKIENLSTTRVNERKYSEIFSMINEDIDNECHYYNIRDK